MSAYLISIIFAAVILLIAVVVSLAIKFQGGANPKDPGKRRAWFWIFAILNPALFYVIAFFVMKPSNIRLRQEWIDSLLVATIIGFVVYIVLGFVLSKVFKNGKLGNWF